MPIQKNHSKPLIFKDDGFKKLEETGCHAGFVFNTAQ